MSPSQDGGELVPTHLEQRPEFETQLLTVEVDDALAVIAETVAGLTSADTHEGVKIRTRDGMLVAVLSDESAEGADVESVLAARTEPPMELATRKARKIREALADHEA